MSTSKAQIRANARYDKKTYDNVLVKIRKDADITLSDVKKFAASCGESTNGFIIRAIKEIIRANQLEHV